MKVAMLGGSFNPLHSGHAMLADTVVKELGYDKVLFVPTHIPPHKQIAGSVSADMRFEMTAEFCATYGNGHFEAEPCELNRQGVSYTYDTLCYLSQKYKNQLDGKIALIMGEEVAAEFYKWYRSEDIADIADFIITARYPSFYSLSKAAVHNVPSGAYTGDFSSEFNADDFKYPFIHIKSPMLPVSSTDVRYRVSQNKSFRYLVPECVFDYILRYGLYKNL